jgi:ferrous iron transport protein B
MSSLNKDGPGAGNAARPFFLALAGNANVGKSSIFNQLTGLGQETGNWGGKTTGVQEGFLSHHGYRIRVVDLPGIYTLAASSAEEQLAGDFILNQHPDMVVNVLDATSLERNLVLTLQLREMGVPLVIALNNADLARKKHIQLDTALLGKLLDAPVISTIAIKGIGVHELVDAALDLKEDPRELNDSLKYGWEIEKRLGELVERMDIGNLRYPARWTAIQLLQGEEGLFQRDNLDTARLVEHARKLAAELVAMHGEGISAVIAAEQYALAASLARRVTTLPVPEKRRRFGLDNLTLHPVFGYILFTAVMAVILVLVSYLGGWVTDGLAWLLAFFAPDTSGKLIDILWNGGAAGLFASLSVGVGFILPFYLILSLLGESGYLPRIAFLMDRPCHTVGLHGQASLPLIMALGCNVTGCLACRNMEGRRDRLLATFLTTLVPCSARTSVVLGLVGAFVGWPWAVGLLVFQMFFIYLLGLLLNRLFPSRSPGIIMEIPEYRVPAWDIVWRQTWFKFREFLVIGVPLIVAGSLAIESLRVFNWLDYVTDLLKPVTVDWLGLPAFTGVLLIFGILRKEANLALLLSFAGGAAVTSIISPLQMVVLAIVILLYIPCISTIAVLVKETGVKLTALMVVAEIALAILIGGIGYRLLGLVF